MDAWKRFPDTGGEQKGDLPCTSSIAKPVGPGTPSARATEQLARELSTYTTASELADLDAILRRHHDAAEAEKVRRLVNWSSAA